MQAKAEGALGRKLERSELQSEVNAQIKILGGIEYKKQFENNQNLPNKGELHTTLVFNRVVKPVYLEMVFTFDEPGGQNRIVKREQIAVVTTLAHLRQ